MAKIGEIVFHPQDAFTQEERRAIIDYVKGSLRGAHGFSPIEEVHRPGFVIKVRDRRGYQVYNPWKRSFKQVFDFDVRRPVRPYRPRGRRIQA
jgi:hypothetical protein